jgi:hypothetical protein
VSVYLRAERDDQDVVIIVCCLSSDEVSSNHLIALSPDDAATLSDSIQRVLAEFCECGDGVGPEGSVCLNCGGTGILGEAGR